MTFRFASVFLSSAVQSSCSHTFSYIFHPRRADFFGPQPSLALNDELYQMITIAALNVSKIWDFQNFMFLNNSPSAYALNNTTSHITLAVHDILGILSRMTEYVIHPHRTSAMKQNLKCFKSLDRSRFQSPHFYSIQYYWPDITLYHTFPKFFIYTVIEKGRLVVLKNDMCSSYSTSVIGICNNWRIISYHN